MVRNTPSLLRPTATNSDQQPKLYRNVNILYSFYPLVALVAR